MSTRRQTFFGFILVVAISEWQHPKAATPEYNISFLQQVLQRMERRHWPMNTIVIGSLDVNMDTLDNVMTWLNNASDSASYVFHVKNDKTLWFSSLRNYIKDDTLTLVLCHCKGSDIVWLQLDQRLSKLRQSKLVLILSERRNYGHKALFKLFNKLWKLQFLNVIVLHNGNIYHYTPYPVVRYFRLQGEERMELLPPRNNDFKGYVVSTPIDNDIPRVFFVTNPRTGVTWIRGFGYRIFAEFLKRHNATLEITNEKANHTNVNMSHINEMIGRGELEITVHPYTGIKSSQGMLSYPILKARNCLIVPMRNEIPRYMYLVRPFDWNYCLLIFGGFLYITTIIYLVKHKYEWTTRWAHLTRSLLGSLRFLLYMPTSRYKIASKFSYFIIIFLMFIFGFCISNWYTNVLGSFLTTSLTGEQFDTFEQLIAGKLQILVKSYEAEMVLDQVPPHLKADFEPLLVRVSANEQIKQLLNFNRSFAYPFTVERWHFFELQQQYAHKPIYRYSSICLGSPNIGFPMRHNSHLESPLKIFIMKIQMAGLLYHWSKLDFKDALMAGYVQLINNEIEFVALDINTLYIAWVILIVGLSLSIIAFFIELLQHRRVKN